MVERWNGDVHVAALEELGHRSIEEGENERADVRSVDIRVRHHDDAAVAQVGDVELVAEARSDRRDHRLDLGVREHLVDAVLLGVDDLPAQRQDRLRHPVARLFGGTAGGVALDDEELRGIRVLDRAVGELARKRRVLERALSPCQLTCFPCRLAGIARRNRLGDDLTGLGLVFLQELRELLIDDLLDQPCDSRVSKLGLRLTLELRVPELHGDDGSQSFARVLALEVVVALLEESLLARVLVERTSQSSTKALQMRATLGGVDVVREREDGLDVRVVPLHRDLESSLVALALEVDDVLVHGVLRLVDMRNEVPDPALVEELVGPTAGALVAKDDPQPAGEERRLAQALEKRGGVEVRLLEHLGVGQEGDDRPGLVLRSHADCLHVSCRLAASELLPVHLAVASHLGDEPLGEGVDDRDADSVQAARDLVAIAPELPARMELRQNHRQCRESLLGDHVHRDPRAGVPHGHGVVRMDRDVDEIVSPRECLVDRVVDYLVDEVMQATRARRPDVHTGS